MTNGLTRRRFLSTGAAASIVALPSHGVVSGVTKPAEIPQRRFYSNLSLERLGFHASFEESLELAVKYGFEGVDPDLDYFAALEEDQFRHQLENTQAKNLKFGAAGLPVEFRRDDTTFSAGYTGKGI